MNKNLFGENQNKFLTPIIDVIDLSKELFSESLWFVATSIDLSKEYFQEKLRRIVLTSD